jgi:hypothetical protein
MEEPGEETIPMNDEIHHDASGAPMQASGLVPHITVLIADAEPTGDEAPQSGTGRTLVYAIISVALGLAVGGAFATTAIRPAGRTGTLDLGQMLFSPAGVKGHLVLNWDKKLVYKLAVEPSDPARAREFAQVIAVSPRPLAVAIELKDADGYALCMKSIAVKYDPMQALPGGAQPGAPATQPAPAAELERQQQQEVARERGKDLFQNQAGQDGQIQSISASGDIPCSNQDYASAVSWSFAPDFPSADEQDAWLERQTGAAEGTTAAVAEASASRTAAQRRAKKKAAEQSGAFAIEGDDELVGIDSSRGIAKTTTSITFLLSAATAKDAAARWQDLPASIHYKCDMNYACTLTHRGAVVLTAQLRR